jgi:predicted permease
MKHWRRFWRVSVEEEVESELSFHIDMTIHELMKRGSSEREARAEAERRFGNPATVDAECRRYAYERDQNARRAELHDEIRNDVAFALRQIRRSPGFSLVSVLTLALGIGATAAIFSVLNAVVLRPLPFTRAEQIVVVSPTLSGEPSGASVPEFLAYQTVKEFTHVAAAVLGSGISMKLGDVPTLVASGRVTPDYFAVFGAAAQLGRTFLPEEGTPSRPNVAVISHRLWVSAFNGDRATLGRSVSLDGTPHTIVGIMPASFDVTRGSEDIWVPLTFTAEQRTKYTERYLTVLARIRDGISIRQAQVATASAERGVVQQMPDRSPATAGWSARLDRYIDDLVGDYRSLLFILLGAVGFVLLIACTNVANLLLAKGSVRARELAIRSALGAGRARLLRQLLTENATLALAGAVLGSLVAFFLVKVVVRLGPEDVPRLEQTTVDWRVLAFTFSVGLASSLLFGLVPALRLAGPRLLRDLREGGRGTSSSRDPLRAILVVVEVALAITLLIGSGLLIRTAWRIQHVDPGFDARGVLAARLLLPASRYPLGADVARAFQTMRDEAARMPGVKSAAITSVVPLEGSNMTSSVAPQDLPPGQPTLTANMRLVSSGYFATMGISLVAGRDIAATDVAASPHVLVVNEALVRKLWPGRDLREAIGKRVQALSPKTDPSYFEVVGVVSDLHDASLSAPPQPAFYAPITQTPELIWPLIQRSLVIVVRGAATDASAEAFIKPLGRVVARFDPLLPIAEARTMRSFLRSSIEVARTNTVLLSALAAIALTLAMIGIFGVVSYFVAQRTKEIGIRIALGASPGMIWRFVVRRGLVPVLIGVLLGSGLAVAAATLLRGQLYGVGPHDPVTFISVEGLLVLIAIVAMFIPARRAMRVAPIVALGD